MPIGMEVGQVFGAAHDRAFLCTMGRPLFLKIALPMAMWTTSNTWFPGPTRVLNPNAASLDRFSRFCTAH